MTDKKSQPSSRYMTYDEVMHQLGLSRTGVALKVRAGHLIKVNIGNAPYRENPRITRESFEAYCARIEER